MKLISAHIKNIRLHKDIKIDFDEKLTLIGGPNESGKSTIAEAIHKCLFMKANGNTEQHREMISKLHFNESPHVELVFEVLGNHYNLEKKFGVNGSIRLTLPNNSQLIGQPAEEKLSELLQAETGLTQSSYKTQWNHLWVWQGSSANEPWEYADTRRSNLIKGLKNQGAAAITQTSLDMHIASQFKNRNSILLYKGKPKSNTEWDFLEKQLNDKKQILDVAESRVSSLINDANDLDRLVPEINDLKRNLIDNEAIFTNLNDRKREVDQLRHELETQTIRLNQAIHDYRTLNEAQTEIINTQNQIDGIVELISPISDDLVELNNDIRNKRAELETKEREYSDAQGNLGLLRKWFAYYQSFRELIQHERVISDLRATMQLITQSEQEDGQISEQLAGIIDIDDKKLKQLDKIQRKITKVEAVIESIATGIKLIQTTSNVTINGSILSPDDSEVITEVATIQVGKGTSFEISPGGGVSLQERKDELNDLNSQLNQLLIEYGVTSYEQALNCKQQRDNLLPRLENIRQRLVDLDSENKRRLLTDKANELTQLQMRVNNLKTDLAITNNDELQHRELIDQLFTQAKENISKFETEVDDLNRKVLSFRSQLDLKQRRRQELDDAIQDKTAEQNTKQGRISYLIETFGDTVSRQEALNEALATKNEEQHRYNAIHDRLRELEPEQLSADLERITRILSRTREELQNKIRRHDELDSLLKADGGADPREVYEKAKNDFLMTDRQCKIAERSAKAIELIDNLFSSEQQNLSKSFTVPLAEKVAAYLQFIFGPKTVIDITEDNNKFKGITISREKFLEKIPLEYKELSGGAREQVAVAMRLAMAEVLAPDHGGCLPVVLDDAFTNSDTDRNKALQNMLDYAAYQRGLQIIVLSCNPKDYDNLGAKKVELATSYN